MKPLKKNSPPIKTEGHHWVSIKNKQDYIGYYLHSLVKCRTKIMDFSLQFQMF